MSCQSHSTKCNVIKDTMQRADCRSGTYSLQRRTLFVRLWNQLGNSFDLVIPVTKSISGGAELTSSAYSHNSEFKKKHNSPKFDFALILFHHRILQIEQPEMDQRGVPEFGAQITRWAPVSFWTVPLVAMAKGQKGAGWKSPLALSQRCAYMMLVLGAPLLMLLDATIRTTLRYYKLWDI